MLHIVNTDLEISNFNLEKLLKTSKNDLQNLEFWFSKIGRHPEHWLPRKYIFILQTEQQCCCGEKYQEERKG